ncbi:hypothetical protein B0H14DRAFT_3479427 [Mycena olivaceomarginata]|nr:hypothetical protein B0H14DRAFT_3479427 [Mycena olivaceomarginata]
MQTQEEDPDFIAARLAAVQRSLDMVCEAAAERERSDEGDWLWAYLQAHRACQEYSYERLQKIRRADARRTSWCLYLSRRAEYALKRGSEHVPSPYEGRWDEAAWGEGEWGKGEWGSTTDPAWQDSGFWLKPEDDNISPIVVPRPLPFYLL